MGNLAFVNLPEMLSISLAFYVPSGFPKVSTLEICVCRIRLISSCSVFNVLRNVSCLGKTDCSYSIVISLSIDS